PIVEVEGIIRLDGKPLNKVEVRFIPMIDYGPEYVAVGVTDEAGGVKPTCKGHPGAWGRGKRGLVVEGGAPARLRGAAAPAELARYFQSLGGRPLPQRYADLTESPLNAHVTPEQKEYTFELTR